MEWVEIDLLFPCFVGFVGEPAWDHSSFSNNRDRLLKGQIATKFLVAIVSQLKAKRLLSSDHFSVGGTLLETWGSIKSFRSHRSTTDPQARPYRRYYPGP